MENENTDAINAKEDLFFAYVDNHLVQKKISIEQLKSYEGFKNVENEDTLEIINGLYELSIITYKIYNNEKNRN